VAIFKKFKLIMSLRRTRHHPISRFNMILAAICYWVRLLSFIGLVAILSYAIHTRNPLCLPWIIGALVFLIVAVIAFFFASLKPHCPTCKGRVFRQTRCSPHHL